MRLYSSRASRVKHFLTRHLPLLKKENVVNFGYVPLCSMLIQNMSCYDIAILARLVGNSYVVPSPELAEACLFP